MSRYPFIKQHDEKDCGAASLSMISEYYGLKLPIARFRELIKVDNQGANIYGIVTGAQKIGLEADALEGTKEELLEGISNGEVKFPFIARIINEQMYEHFVVIFAIKKDKFLVGDPGKDKINKISKSQFLEQWQGQIVTFVPNQNFEKKNERKGTFKKFFPYILLQKKLLFFVFIMSVIISAINISGSIIFEYILSDSIELSANKDILISNIRNICVTIIFMYILRSMIQILRGYLLATATRHVDVSLSLNYYNHLVDLPSDFHETRKTGEFMSRFYDTSKIRDAISTAALTIMLDTIMAMACGALLYHINAILFLITCIIIIVYAVIMFLFKRPIKTVNHELMENESQVTSYLKESIDGLKTVKAYQYESTVKAKTKKLYEKFADKNVKGSFIYTLQDSLVLAVESIGVVTLLWVGTYLCLKNVIEIADLFVFYYLMNYFLEPISNLINLQPQMQTAIVAAERLNDILDAKIEKQDVGKLEVTNLQGDIKIENINFRYGNRDLVLKDVSMCFPKNKKIAIVGESGCGKTTLAKLLLSFYKPESGNIMIDGTDISEYGVSLIRKHIAYVSQDIFLFSDTIYNNLKYGNTDVTEEEIKKMCRICKAEEFIEKLPLKYDTVIEENGNNLSGGQKQRLAIVRALLKKPDILILDEATSNLDTITEESISRAIENFSDKMTCIIIAHRMNTIKNCDYIYVMDKGRVIEQGTHKALLDKNGMYKKYINSNNSLIY